jgi:hypothetical protein
MAAAVAGAAHADCHDSDAWPHRDGNSRRCALGRAPTLGKYASPLVDSTPGGSARQIFPMPTIAERLELTEEERRTLLRLVRDERAMTRYPMSPQAKLLRLKLEGDSERERPRR